MEVTILILIGCMMIGLFYLLFHHSKLPSNDKLDKELDKTNKKITDLDDYESRLNNIFDYDSVKNKVITFEDDDTV